MDPEKIKAVMEWKKPPTVKSLRAFLALVGYYIWFVKNFGQIAHPLTSLLKKNAYRYY